MSHYIILQYPYESIEIALCKQGSIIQKAQLHKFKATALTIPSIQKLLEEHNLTLSDIVCIGANIGPGPYNTLRALLTMANGIHFVRNMPLVKSSALELLPQEYPNHVSITLLHAFADHIFYNLTLDDISTQGACSISEIVKLINQHTEPILALGNGADIHKEILKQNCKQLTFLEPTPSFNRLETLAQTTYKKFSTNNYPHTYLKPIYFEDLTSS